MIFNIYYSDFQNVFILKMASERAFSWYDGAIELKHIDWRLWAVNFCDGDRELKHFPLNEK